MTTAIEAMLEELNDYAGLFPPAGLDMKTAVRNYSEYLSGDDAWMLGRFVVPAQRLGEFASVFTENCCDEQASPWLLSVVASGNEEDLQYIADFVEGASYLDAIEFKADNIEHAEKVLLSVPSSMAAYVEFAPNKSEEMLPLLKKYDARAKIRCGGVTAEAIPTKQSVAHFIAACANAGVAFKATAGLHHPLRSMQKLTYERASASALMFGFANVFVAATMAYNGASKNDIIPVLGEESPQAFTWEKDKGIWLNYSYSAAQIAEAREKFAVSFGSCSFTEPVQDLKTLGWL
ncbi:hypothetical protein [Acidobacterium sp. S8]|uniref:hypothetical protein n=1 Tax=Acidobacterium sp. S8 TaxID=1641854 RepID=UPI00131D93A9|nr:hypothetical protein [Acidobacterium sp. S8]